MGVHEPRSVLAGAFDRGPLALLEELAGHLAGVPV
jgi:hypothetical protein